MSLQDITLLLYPIITIKRFFFNSNTTFLFYLVNTLKFSKVDECVQSDKWLLAALLLGLTFFLVKDEIPIYSPILTLRCLTHSL